MRSFGGLVDLSWSDRGIDADPSVSVSVNESVNDETRADWWLPVAQGDQVGRRG